MSEELWMTLEALEELVRSPARCGWRVQVYDYTGNAWRDGGTAFSSPGTYELAVLVPPRGRPVRVHLLPSGSSGLQLEPGSVGDPGLWRALAVRLRARHLELMKALVKGRTSPVGIAELASMLEAHGGDAALEALGALRPLVRGGGL